MTQPISKNYIASLIPKGALILDVGSYNGQDAAELAEACNTCVHCFEPYEPNRDLIVAKQNPLLYIWPYALGAFNGTSMMNVADSHPQSNTLSTPKLHTKVWPDIKYNETPYKINITTLDNWFYSWIKQSDDRHIELIWCDVNGSEGNFILGGSETLKVTKYLYIEFCVKELFAKCMNKERMLKALPGFELVGEFNVGVNYGNLLLKNKNKELWAEE